MSKIFCTFVPVFNIINMSTYIKTLIWAPQSTFNIHGDTHHVVEDIKPDEDDSVSSTPSAITPDFYRVSARFSEENIRERLEAELNQSHTKIEYCRALYRLQYMGCINLNQYASDAQRAIVFNRYQSKFNLSASDFCKARIAK